jgi:hypothetical protein
MGRAIAVAALEPVARQDVAGLGRQTFIKVARYPRGMVDSPAQVLACQVQTRPRPLLLAGLIVGAIVGTLLLPLDSVAADAVFIVAGAAGIATWISSWHRPARVALEPGSLRVDYTRNHRILAAEEIANGYYVPGANRVTLRLTNGEQVHVDVDRERNQGTAEQLLVHLALAPRQRAVVVPLDGTFGTVFVGLMAFLFGLLLIAVLAALFEFTGAAVGAGLTLLLTFLVPLRLGRQRVVVGADGIRVVGRLAPLFIPFDQLRSARLDPLLVLTQKNGRTLRLGTLAQSEEESNALLERIEEGIRMWGEREEGAGIDVLDRNGRSVEGWKQELARLAHSEHGFREQALGPDDFERVVSDPSAPADRRVGAAIALRALGPTATARVRVAAASLANDRLRVALEAACEGEVDEQALTDALEAQRLEPRR